MRLLSILAKSLLLCLLVAVFSAASPQETDIAASGDTSLRAVLDKKTVLVTLHTAKVKKSDPGFPLALDYYDEVSVVQNMNIVVDGKTVGVPRSAYADLFNARKAVLRFEDGTFFLLVGGADASDLYSVHLYFDATRIIRRSVFDSASPHKPLEETRYYPAKTIG
jgi:hypothetical protein